MAVQCVLSAHGEGGRGQTHDLHPGQEPGKPYTKETGLQHGGFLNTLQLLHVMADGW